jgi:ribonuclease HI
MTIEIYTDGASKGNPGRGGWGCYARFSDTNTKSITYFCADSLLYTIK